MTVRGQQVILFSVFPAQTSFIPITVALVRFIEANGFSGNYPYWYLGITPTKYLIGPVVPIILGGLYKFLPQVSLFDLSYALIFASIFISSVGWGMLAWKLSQQRKIGVLVGLVSLVLPWHWVSALALSEVSAVFAGALTPWVLLAFLLGPNFEKAFGLVFSRILNYFSDLTQASARHQENSNSNVGFGLASSSFSKSYPRKSEVYPERKSKGHVFDWGQSYTLSTLTFALLLLTNSTASLSAIAGLFILGIIFSKNWGDGIKRVFFVIVAGWVLSTLWYGPNYWLTIFGAPSVGGKSLVGALFNIIGLLRGFIPVGLAILVVLGGIRPKNLFDKFAYSWFGIFATLTLIRFMADPKFWMDWVSWMGEVEIGLAMIMARNFQFRKLGVWSLVIGVFIVGGWSLVWAQRDFWLPRRSVENMVEYKIAKVLELETRNWKQETGNDPTVFLSGTTAFWLNAFVDIRQVRGGRDEVSGVSGWRDVVWEVREGYDWQLSHIALSKLKVDYLVVHGDNSKEYYHDFLYPDKFNKSSNFLKIFDDGQDYIYKL